jgi:hypothetical protein
MIPETVHQMLAPKENVLGDGLLLLTGSNVAAPSPIPSRLRTSCTTGATVTPANTATQERRLVGTGGSSSSGAIALVRARLDDPGHAECQGGKSLGDSSPVQACCSRNAGSPSQFFSQRRARPVFVRSAQPVSAPCSSIHTVWCARTGDAKKRERWQWAAVKPDLGSRNCLREPAFANRSSGFNGETPCQFVKVPPNLHRRQRMAPRGSPSVKLIDWVSGLAWR